MRHLNGLRFRRVWYALLSTGAVAGCALTGLVMFDNERGKFELPDYVVPANSAAIPARLDCGDRITIYAARAEIVESCRGLGGPQDLGNRVCAAAAGRAGAAARRPQCPDACPKQIREIYRGWECKRDVFYNTLDAKCAVELDVRCPVEG